MSTVLCPQCGEENSDPEGTRSFLVSLVSPNVRGYRALIAENSTPAGQPIVYGVEQFWRYPNPRKYKPLKAMW